SDSRRVCHSRARARRPAPGAEQATALPHARWRHLSLDDAGRGVVGARPQPAEGARRALHVSRASELCAGVSRLRGRHASLERLAVDRLTRLLERTGRVQVVGTTTDPEEALSFLNANGADVLFLDIQMPGLTGFQLLEKLERQIPVVFTTAYDRYALDAFEVN